MWKDDFRKRMNDYKNKSPRGSGEPVSIKIRVTGGCFHRSCCPNAYRIIDDYLLSLEIDCDFKFEEHESGPEILVYLALTVAGINLASSLVNLIVTIIKARSEGIRKGDRHREQSIEIIVRKIQRNDEYVEENIMRIESNDLIDKANIKKALEKAIKKQLKEKDV